MSSLPPLVVGTISAGRQTAGRELPLSEDLRIGANRTVVDHRGQDLLERARQPIVDSLPWVFIQECRYNGGEYVSTGNDPSWFPLPQGRIPYPRLLTMGVLNWLHSGVYFNSGAVTQTIEFELLVDGSPTSPATILSWPITAVAGFPTITIFTAQLTVIGDYDGSTLYHLEGRLRMQEGHTGTYGTVLDVIKAARPTIAGGASRVLGFRFRRALNQANEALTMKNSLGWQMLHRSGL